MTPCTSHGDSKDADGRQIVFWRVEMKNGWKNSPKTGRLSTFNCRYTIAGIRLWHVQMQVSLWEPFNLSLFLLRSALHPVWFCS